MDAPSPTPPLKFVLEAILFSAQKPLSTKDLRDLLNLAAQDESAPEAATYRKLRDDDLAATLAELEQDHQTANRSYRLACINNAWQFVSEPEFAPWLRALLGRKARPTRLSQPAVETLTIIAYRQPVTRAEIEQIRGVNIDGVMQTLLERGLIEAAGRAEAAGRPVTYATTPLFLEYFGIRALEDLPAADELRRLPIQKPESLLTAEPNTDSTPTPPTPSPDPAPTPTPPPDPAHNPVPAPPEPGPEPQPEPEPEVRSTPQEPTQPTDNPPSP
jgi:segregation and condensation protein B